MNKSIILITQKAWDKIFKINKLSINHFGFLFSAKSGGCNGFNYNLSILKEKEYVEIHKGKIKPNYVENSNIKVFIDPMSEFYLVNTTIDYVSEDLSKNIFENKFTFTPDKNKASTCGCGVSFSPKL
tara:strand:+ start:2314 stop:2694 length:381 start_codon:yes stop_codon:yes gene_type:complete